MRTCRHAQVDHPQVRPQASIPAGRLACAPEEGESAHDARLQRLLQKHQKYHNGTDFCAGFDKGDCEVKDGNKFEACDYWTYAVMKSAHAYNASFVTADRKGRISLGTAIQRVLPARAYYIF
eukprot:5606609-Prymnesium_polylepis.1